MANIGSISEGVITRLDTAITAPVAGNTFQFQPDSATTDFSALFQAVGTVTTLSADLQASTDGGVTWSNVTGKTAIITAAAPCAIVTNLVSNVLYRLNYTIASGSSNVNVVSN